MNLAKTRSVDATSLTVSLTWAKNVEFAGYYVAQKLGYFKDVELDVSFEAGGTVVDPRTAVADGSAAIGIVEETMHIILGISQGIDNLVIGSTYQKNCTCLMARAESGIKSLEDLRGKRLGLHPVEVDSMSRLLAANGLPAGSYEVVEEVGFGVEAFLAGQVDARIAAFWYEPLLLEAEGVKTNVIFYQPGYGDSLVVKKETVQKHPDMLAAFVRASQKGWEYTLRNPELVVQMVIDGFVELGEQPDQQRAQLDIQLSLLQRTSRHGLMGMEPTIWADGIDYFRRLGLLARPLSVDDVMTLEILERAKRL